MATNMTGDYPAYPTGLPYNSSLDYEDYDQELDASNIIIPSIYALVCCVGLTGNAMVIYVILKYAKMKTATNIYILNLAIADELFMLSVPFLATSAAVLSLAIVVSAPWVDCCSTLASQSPSQLSMSAKHASQTTPD
ncbi:unnamed protein product [Coregonus sp. 'balchen']|nr:unnamed protein product [Coregonus sp. 'balchen']